MKNQNPIRFAEWTHLSLKFETIQIHVNYRKTELFRGYTKATKTFAFSRYCQKTDNSYILHTIRYVEFCKVQSLTNFASNTTKEYLEN